MENHRNTKTGNSWNGEDWSRRCRKGKRTGVDNKSSSTVYAFVLKACKFVARSVERIVRNAKESDDEINAEGVQGWLRDGKAMEMRIFSRRRLILTRTAAGTARTSIFNYYLRVCTRDGPTADEYKMTPQFFLNWIPLNKVPRRVPDWILILITRRITACQFHSGSRLRPLYEHIYIYIYTQRYLVMCNINYTLTVFS